MDPSTGHHRIPPAGQGHQVIVPSRRPGKARICLDVARSRPAALDVTVADRQDPLGPTSASSAGALPHTIEFSRLIVVVPVCQAMDRAAPAWPEALFAIVQREMLGRESTQAMALRNPRRVVVEQAIADRGCPVSEAALPSAYSPPLCRSALDRPHWPQRCSARARPRSPRSGRGLPHTRPGRA